MIITEIIQNLLSRIYYPKLSRIHYFSDEEDFKNVLEKLHIDAEDLVSVSGVSEDEEKHEKDEE